MAIKTFKNAETESLFKGVVPKRFSTALGKVGRRKLDMISAAKVLDDLKSPPGNKLHALKDDRMGQHAIWINNQYRVCFRWTDVGAEEVEIVDYH